MIIDNFYIVTRRCGKQRTAAFAQANNEIATNTQSRD